jgi:peptide/nickel transport system substrate-binding protein
MSAQNCRPPVVRRSLAAALSLLLACTAGCQRTEQGKTEVTVIGAEAPAFADPAAGPLTEVQAVLLSNVAQGLVRFDASGQIVPGLAERWNVTDDGMSYIFRLQSAQWPDGRKISAQQVARLLRRQIAARSRNTLKDTLGAVDQIVAMTDRVIEISLKAPRPNLLALLAQPELALIYENQGSGPFRIAPGNKPPKLSLVRTISDLDEEVTREDEVLLGSSPASAAVRAFLAERTDLVLGGTYADLPYARADNMPRNALRFDPAAGLFGLVPARADGPLADVELRRLLTQAIDRQALIDAFSVPGLLPRATVLEPGLEGVPNPTPPQWMALPIAERRLQLASRAAQMFGGIERPVIRVALPDAPGARILLNRLIADWGTLGIKVERVEPGRQADLKLVDAVAPSTSPAWFLRQFQCGLTPVCDEEADELMDGARGTPVPAQRNALLAQAAQLIDEQQLFIPIAAPIRWSLVSNRVQGIAANRYARHSLAGLGERLDRNRGE